MDLTESMEAMELVACDCHACNELIELNGQVFHVTVLPWMLGAYPELHHACMATRLRSAVVDHGQYIHNTSR